MTAAQHLDSLALQAMRLDSVRRKPFVRCCGATGHCDDRPSLPAEMEYERPVPVRVRNRCSGRRSKRDILGAPCALASRDQTLKLDHLANPDAFDRKIELHRERAKSLYRDALWHSIDLYKRAAPGVNRRDAHTDPGRSSNPIAREHAYVLRCLVVDLADRALWAMTEILPQAASKYLGQRYISEGVEELWRQQARVNEGGLARFFMKNGKCELRHEHVVPRALLRQLLLACESAEQVGLVLDCSIACVVLKSEDERIPDSGRGWDRYGDLVVIDRRESNERGSRTIASRIDPLESLSEYPHLLSVLSLADTGSFAEVKQGLNTDQWTTRLSPTGRVLEVMSSGFAKAGVVKWKITRAKQRLEWGELAERFTVESVGRQGSKVVSITAAEVLELIQSRGEHSSR